MITTSISSLSYHRSRLLVSLLPSIIFLLNVTAASLPFTPKIQRAQSILAPAADRSIWTFTPSSSSSSSPHFSTFTPFSQPPPPPASSYPSNFSVATFNGRNHFIDLYSPVQDGGSRAVSPMVSDSWSFASWFYIDSMTTGKSRVLISRSTSQLWQANRALVITIAADGHLAFSYFNDRGAFTLSGYSGWSTEWIPPLRQWHHIGLVYNATTDSYFFYLGGHQIGLQAFSIALGGKLVTNETLTYSTIGRSDLAVFTKDTLPFQGSLYALGFFDFALPADDMLALASPVPAQSIPTSARLSYTSLTVPSSTDPNPLTTVLAPWKYYHPDTITAGSYIDLQLLTPKPSASQCFGARQQWSISFYIKFTQPPNSGMILWMKDGTTNSRLFQLAWNGASVELSHGIIGNLALSNYPIFTSYLGSWSGGPTLLPVTDWNRLTITYDGSDSSSDLGLLSSYLNENQISHSSVNLTLAPLGPQIYTSNYLGYDGTNIPTLGASFFGFTIWQGVLLSESDIAALVVPTIVEYVNDAPATVAAGSTMRVTFTATLTQTNSSLIVRGGDGLLAVYQLLNFTLQPSYRVEFIIPTARVASTYTITFDTPTPDPTQRLPAPLCIEVVDTTADAAASVIDTDLTLLTVKQLLDTADWTLPLLPPFIGNGGGCSLMPAPSGVVNESLLTCNGGTADYINLTDSSQTKVLPWPGIDINPTAFTFAFWLYSNVNVSVGSFNIFYAKNQASGIVAVRIVILNGFPVVTVNGPAGLICGNIAPSVPIFQQPQVWQHLAVTFGSGGCNVFVDSELGLTSGAQSASWTSTFTMQPITSDFVYLSGYPTVTPFNASYASIHFWNRELSQKEITFLASNKPAALQIPTTRTRRIAVLGLPSASQLLQQAAFFHTFDRAPRSGILIPAPSGASGYHIVAFDGTQPYGFDFTSPQDVATGSGPTDRHFPSTLFTSSQSFTFTMWFQMAHINGSSAGDPRLLYLSDGINHAIEIRPTEMRMNYGSVTLCRASVSSLPTCPSCFIHITAIYNAATSTCALFINGQRVASSPVALFTQWLLFQIYFGDPAPNNHLKGMVAQFGYWKRALTGIEINRLANSPPLSVALPSNQHTRMTAAHTILLNADYDFVPTRQYQSSVTASQVDFNQPNGLSVAVYSGDAGQYTDLNDLTAIGTGLSYRFPYLLSSTITLALWIFVPSRNSLPDGIVTPCIFNAATSSQTEEISLRHIVVGTNNDFEFRLTNGPLTICHLRLVNSTAASPSLQSFPSSQWIHLAATFDTRGICSLYLNGALASSAPGDCNYTSSTVYPTFTPIARTSTYLGMCQQSEDYRFIGKMAQFTMWQRSLDQAEIAVLYTRPPPNIARLLLPASSLTLLDSSTPPHPIAEWLFPQSDVGRTSYPISVPGGVSFPSSSAASPVNLLLSSDNPTSKQTLPLVFGGDSFSFEMWLRMTSPNTPGYTQTGFRLFECSSDSDIDAANGENILAIGAVDLSFYFETSVSLINSVSNTSIQNRISSPNLSYLVNKLPLDWQHLAVVYDSESQLVMISHNGAIVKSQSWRNAFDPAALRAVRQKCLLGGSRNQAAYQNLDFQIQYFSYHNSALLPSQLLALYRNRRSTLITPGASPTNVTTTQQLLLSSAFTSVQYLTGVPPQSSIHQSPTLTGTFLNFQSSAYSGLGNFITLDSPSDIQGPPYRGLWPSSLAHIRISGLSIAFWLRVSGTWPSPTHLMEWHLDTQAQTRMMMRVLSMKPQVQMIENGVVLCTMNVDQPIVVDATLFHHYIFVFNPDNSIQYYIDGVLQLPIASTGVCASSISNTASFSSLPWIDGYYGKVQFGGGDLVTGTSSYGITGDVAMLSVFTRALVRSEITLLHTLTPGALTRSQVPATTSGILSNSRDSARFSWRFNTAPNRPSSSDIILEDAPSGIGSIGRMTSSKGQYMSLSDWKEPYYRDLFSLRSDGNYTFGVSMWIKLVSAVNNTVIFELSGTTQINYRVRLSIMGLDMTTRVGTRLALLVTDSADAPLFQLVTQSDSVRLNDWQHIVFAITSSYDPPSRAVIFIDGAFSTGQIVDGTIPAAERIGYIGYDRSLGKATLDASLAELSIWQLTGDDDPMKMLFLPEIILDHYRSPPPQLIGMLDTDFDLLLRSASVSYNCWSPIYPNLATSQQVIYRYDTNTFDTYCVFDAAGASFLDLMNPFDNPFGSVLPPTLTTSSTLLGSLSDSTTRGMSFSMHIRLTSYPQTKMDLFAIGNQGSQNGLIQLYFTSSSQTQLHAFSFIVCDAVGTTKLTASASVPWNQLPLNTPLHLVIIVGGTTFSMYVNGAQMLSSQGGTVIPGLVRPFGAFGRGVNNVTNTNFQGHLGLFAVFSRMITVQEVKQLAAYIPPTFIVSAAVDVQTNQTSLVAGWNQTIQISDNVPLTCKARRPIQTQVVFTSSDVVNTQTNVDLQCDQVHTVSVVNATTAICYPPIEVSTFWLNTQFYTSSALDYFSPNTLLFPAPNEHTLTNLWMSFITSLGIIPSPLNDILVSKSSVTISPPLNPFVYAYTATFSSYAPAVQFSFVIPVGASLKLVDSLSKVTRNYDWTAATSAIFPLTTDTGVNIWTFTVPNQGVYTITFVNTPPILTLQVKSITPPTQSSFTFASKKSFTPSISQYTLTLSQLTRSITLGLTFPPNVKVSWWTNYYLTPINLTTQASTFGVGIPRGGEPTTIYFQTEPFLILYQLLVRTILTTPTPMISTLTLKLQKPHFPDYVPGMTPSAFQLFTTSYSLESPSSAYTTISLHFQIIPGDTLYITASPKGEMTTVGYPTTDVSLGLTGTVGATANTITIVSEYEGTCTINVVNPLFALQAMRISEFLYSTAVSIPPPSYGFLPVFSPDIFDYNIVTFDITKQVSFALTTTAEIWMNMNASYLPVHIPSGGTITSDWGMQYGKGVFTVQTQDGNYTVTIDATASHTIAVPFYSLRLQETSPVIAFDFTTPLSLSTSFSYIAYAPTHVTPVAYSLQVTCVAQCPSTLYMNRVKVVKIADGTNLISLGTLPAGPLKLQLLAPNSVPFYRNYSILFNVPKPQPCLVTTCLNGGVCIDNPSATYNTTYTCYCTAMYEGALCEKVSTTPYTPTYPTAVIFASASSVTDCMNLTLDGTDSYGLGPAVLNPYYYWSLTGMKLSGVELVDQSDPSYSASYAASTFLKLDSSMVTLSTLLPATSIVVISSLQLLTNASYTFGLRVGNVRETSPVVSVTILKVPLTSYAWQPSLGLHLPSRVTRPNIAVATSILTPSSCQPMPSEVTSIYSWTVSMTNKLPSASPLLPDINSIPQPSRQFNSSTPNILSISANFFRVGYQYSVTLDLSLVAYIRTTNPNTLDIQPTRTTVSFPIVPVASLVTAKIFGSDRERPIDTPFTITADQSVDLDYVDDAALVNAPTYSGLSFAWSCKVVSSGASCTLPNTVDLTQVRVDVPANVMTTGVAYQWTVTATSIIDSSRSASTSIRVTGTASSTAKPPLVAILDAPLRINSEETLRLLASVVTQTTTSPLNMLFSWSLVCVSSGIPVTTLPSLYDSTNLGSAVNSSSLVLLPNLLLVPGVYQFTVLVTDPFTLVNAGTQTYASASTSVSIIVNARPQAGDCTITPSFGISLLTVFTLSCAGWFEPLNANFAPFTYAISYRDTAVNAGSTTYQQLTATSLSSQKSFLLPAGELSLRTQVTDQVGASSNFDLFVDVFSPTSNDFDFLAYIANLTYVQLPVVMAAGDSVASISFIRQIADLVNTARGMSQYQDEMSQSKLLQFNIDLITQHRIVLTSVLQASQSSLDTSTLNVVTQSLIPLTKYAEQLPSGIIANLTSEVASTLMSALSSNRIEPTSAVNDLTQVNSNLMTSCSQLDAVTALAHESMRLRQIHAVAGESIELASINYYAYVERTLVAAGTEVHLPTGESVILTPTAMKNYILRLNQLNISTIDTGGATGAAEMDTRIVTFSSRWSSCRTPPGGTPSLSALTNIEITFPNGDVVDIPSLDTDIIFTIPISKNSTDNILDSARSQLPCPEAPFNRETVANTSFTCQFWNVSSQSYSTQGCHSMGVTFLEDGSTLLQCACSHLTEFAILYAEAEHLYNTDVCALAYSDLGAPVYLAFLLIYCFVGLIALVQLIRMLRNHGVERFIFITLEHALILAICIFRSLNMAMYYRLYESISVSKQIIISSLPYLFYSWIFTLVIVTWATIWYRSSRGERTTNPLESFKLEFFFVNLFLTCAFIIIFGLMSQTTNLQDLRVLNRAGVALTCVVEMGFGLFLVIYGLLLVRALTEHFVSDYAKKLGAIAISFSFAFGISASILAYSVAKEDEFVKHSLAYNSIYFALDIVGLLLVMVLFVNSVSAGTEKSESSQSEGSTTGSYTQSARSHNPLSRSGGAPSAGVSHASSPNDHHQNGGNSKSENIQLANVRVSRGMSPSSIPSPSGTDRVSPPSIPPRRMHHPPSFVTNARALSVGTSPVLTPASPSNSMQPPPLPTHHSSASTAAASSGSGGGGGGGDSNVDESASEIHQTEQKQQQPSLSQHQSSHSQDHREIDVDDVHLDQ